MLHVSLLFHQFSNAPAMSTTPALIYTFLATELGLQIQE